jgi:hypothetical protein
MIFDFATFLEEEGVGRKLIQFAAHAGLLFARRFG